MNDNPLEDIHGYATARRIRLASKARQRVSDLGLTYDDLRYGLMRTTSCTRSPGDRQEEVTTCQRSGDALAMIVAFRDGLVITEVR